ncbi:hypothetical protein HH308_18095 [Gordonia sp. TBRC 11910]|uniref:Uncharacterized protein n=1 Tax=Gordonia asplenii TaxID=2725283 RepID=A0A848KYC1_9ACTN|nr:hypothetical protein [Gordonia asplenii]NMO03127.1 hypothetical protein [Gordonia asplenii]
MTSENAPGTPSPDRRPPGDLRHMSRPALLVLRAHLDDVAATVGAWRDWASAQSEAVGDELLRREARELLADEFLANLEGEVGHDAEVDALREDWRRRGLLRLDDVPDTSGISPWADPGVS